MWVPTGAAEPGLASQEQTLPLPLPDRDDSAAVKQEPAQEAVTKDELGSQADRGQESSLPRQRSIAVKAEKV